MTEDVEGTDIAAAAETDRPFVHLVTGTGRPHLPYLVVSLVSTTLATILDRADVFVLGLAFDAIFNDRAYHLPLVPDGLIPAEPMAQLWFTFYLLVGMKVADVALANLSQITRAIYAQRVLHTVRLDAYDTAQHLEMGFFEDSRTGDVMSVLNNDVNTLEEYLSRGLSMSVRLVVVLVTVMTLMTLLNPQLALFVLVAAPLIAGVNWWFSRLIERFQDAVRSEVGDVNSQLETSLSGIDVIKTSTAEPDESDRLEESSLAHLDARWDSKRFSAFHRPSMRLISGSSLVVTFLVGSYWVIYGPPLVFSGTLTAGQLIPFLFYMQQLADPMRWLATVIESAKRAKAAARRVVGLQDVTRTIDADGGGELPDLDGRVTYEGVRFSYPGADERTIDGVSFDVAAGQTVGLVGSTGAGKSTLIKLLLRYYDPDEGTISVDGHDVRSVSRKSLREHVGYVGQDPFLFNGSVRENVAYGKPDASDDEIRRAAREAGAHRFVQSLDEGYDTEVGERGVKLSGGQRQRIAIARALLADPEILVFDEATSHVDNETEVLIQENLADLTEDRTTFVIAHRLSTVRDADRILVLDDGRVVEDGTHADLVDADGTYANLWRVQVGEVDALPEAFLERARAPVDD